MIGDIFIVSILTFIVFLLIGIGRTLNDIGEMIALFFDSLNDGSDEDGRNS